MTQNNKIDLWLKEFLSNDNKVKAVFDNARNFVVCSAILYAAAFLIKHPENPHFMSYISGSILLLTGLLLAVLNIFHAWLKFQQLSESKILVIILAVIYAVVAMNLVQSLFLAKRIAFTCLSYYA